MSIKVMAAVWDGFPYTGSELLAMLALADWSNIASQSSYGKVKYAHCKKIAVGCGSPVKARGMSRNTARYAAFSIPATSFGGSDGMAKAMPGTLRVPPVFHTHSSCRPMWKWNGSCHQAQLESSMPKSIGASSRQPSGVSDFENQHRLNIEAAIAAEKKAVASIKRMAHNNSAALEALWRWGDGAGGGVLDMIAKELGLHSPASAYPSPASTSKKQIIGNALRTKVFERDAYRCVHCATHLSLTVDHNKPESKGGTLDFDNLQTLCRPCNSRKGVK